MYKYFLIVLLLPMISAAEDAKEDPKSALKKFEGTWNVVEAQRDGEKLTADKIKEIKVTFAGDQMTISDPRADDKATIKIDSSKKPAIIDFKPADDDAVAQGIYEWNGDRLKICWSKVGEARPKDFSDKPKSFFVLEKAK